MSSTDNDLDTTPVATDVDTSRVANDADSARVDAVPDGVTDVTDADTDAGPGSTADSNADVLFDPADRASYEERWTAVQTRFVDDPRDAVEAADKLVAEVVETLTTRFAHHKSALEQQWSAGGDRETEALRQALKGYRAFFHRLLAS